ncbi:MAG: LL-diaminopimelate aminotransferase [Candidatus Zixiibacteriota bacterium]
MRKSFKIDDKISSRLKDLEEYVFFDLAKAKKDAILSGKDVIDLGGGNPDLSPHPKIIEALKKEAEILENHRHPIYEGLPELREKVASWFERRFGVDLDPDSEILILIGSKEGLSHVNLAFIDEGDGALVPDPAYPVYKRGVILAGGKILDLPLFEENSWRPDFKKLLKKDLSKIKLLFLNYPNNPTGALADKEFFKEVVDFAEENELVICHDMAYSEITFDGNKAISLLQIPGAKERTLEFFSFSKTYCMTGWRLGFVVGNEKLINVLKNVEVVVNSGAFHVLQKAAICALSLPDEAIQKLRQTYQERRDVLVNGLNGLGWEVENPKGGIFVWAKIPNKHDSKRMANLLIEKAGIVATPGVGLGSYGEGYLRFSLIVDKERMKEAVKRIKTLSF